MTFNALAGLAVLNLVFLVVGLALLWLLRGFETWREVGRLGGLAYLTGVAALGSTWTLLVLIEVPFSLWVVLGVPACVVSACLLAGRRRGRHPPRFVTVLIGRNLIVASLGIAAVGVFLEAAFRSARLAGLNAWDAWAFWVPKAKAIYYFGGFDERFFTLLPGPSYPPLVPVLDAAAFHVMGSPDVVTLHIQYWVFGVGFFWSLAGLLAPRVPAWILWPLMLLGLTAPRIGSRLHVPEADLLLDYLFVCAAVLMFLWLVERDSWVLATAGILLCGVVLTKREGLLLTTILVVATLLAGGRELRAIWRPLGLTVAVVMAVAIPWRVWYITHGVEGEAPAGGVVPSTDTERLWPSLSLALRVLFDNGYWSLITPIALGALVLGAIARAWTPVVFFGSLVTLVTLGGGWITWAIPELEITDELGVNPIVRFMGAAALACVASAAVLLAAAWPPAASAASGATSRWRRPRLAVVALVAIPLLIYPLSALADGPPRFPTRNDCARVATRDMPGLDVVYGRLGDPVAAEELRAAVTSVGFVGAVVELDSCGRWKVSYDQIESIAQGEALIAEVHAAGFDARIEHEG